MYTEINKQGSCINIPSHVLTQLEHMQATLSAKKLTKLASADKVVYTKVMKLLESYKLEFIQNKDVKRLAIAMLLTQDIKNTAVVVPASCSVWFDGCNTCQVMDNGELACTKMYCHENETPKCLEEKKTVTSPKVPETCSVRFDGCNTCQIMENGEMACTLMYCHENETPKCLQHK